MDEQLSTATERPSRRARRCLRMIRPSGGRAAPWSPEEAARELHERRDALLGELHRRSVARGVPAVAQEEIVNDAITAVVMSPREIQNEHHLVGAFWLAVDHRCRQYREGRHFARLGSRRRVDFDLTATRAAAGANPFDRLELRDRFARAADLIAELDERERRVVSVMATRGVGPTLAARLLDIPLGDARAAARSAGLKLDRVAAIAAAGRMCEFRAGAVVADAEGIATGREAKLARAHVSACVPCGRVYRQIRREMRDHDFQRAAVAAFLPLPALTIPGHADGIGKLAAWVGHRLTFMPRGCGERAAEVLGGAGVIKVAAAGTAIVAAGGALTAPIVRVVEGGSKMPHASADVMRHPMRGALNRDATPRAGTSLSAQTSPSRTTQIEQPRHKARRALPTPPSKSLRYLALGGPSGTSHSATRSRAGTVARVASVSSTAPDRTKSVPPSHSGGGTGLGYLGK